MSRIGKLTQATTRFYLCDMQERFRSAIVGFPQITENCRRLIEAAKHLGIPTIVTEQVRSLLEIN